MKSPPALIKPELLAWARRTSGLSIEAAAKKIDVKPARLTAWEAGEERPSIAQLRKAATVYKRPLAVFFLPAPPADFQTMKDFRRVPGAALHMSPALTYEVRRAHERREVAVELAAAVNESAAPFAHRAQQSEDPEVVATRLREALGISVQEQLDWRNNGTALKFWKQAAEAIGVLVFETEKVEVGEARGFSVAEDLLPVIVLNGKDSHAGRTFTLGHELAHVLIRAGGVCEYLEHAAGPDRATELFCNRVSGALLMPRSVIATEQDAARRSDIDMVAIDRLARRFSVSRAAVLVRLSELSRVPAEKAARAVAGLASTYEPPPKKKDLIIPRHVMVLKWHGRAFSSRVLAAYHSEAITLSEASNYLGLRVKSLPKLEMELWAKKATG